MTVLFYLQIQESIHPKVYIVQNHFLVYLLPYFNCQVCVAIHKLKLKPLFKMLMRYFEFLL